MAYRTCLQVALGRANADLTLTVALIDSAFGPPPSMPGFTATVAQMATGSGDYGVTLDNVLDGFQGYAKLLNGATYLGFVAVNPQELENADVRTSSIDNTVIVGAINDAIAEIHGLLGKNSRMENPDYSAGFPSDLQSYDLLLYDTAAHATAGGATGLLHTYHVTNVYDADHRLLTGVTERAS